MSAALFFRPLCPKCGRGLTRLRITETSEHAAVFLAEPFLWLVVIVVGALFGLVVLEGLLIYLAIAILAVSPFAIIFAVWYDRHDKSARFHCSVCLGNFTRHEVSEGVPG